MSGALSRPDGAPRYYSGIGSRETPQSVLALMREIAIHLASEGYVLRSGAAPGADSAFERAALAAGGEVHLYLPWPKYEGRRDHVRLTRPTRSAMRIAEEHHPAWDRLTWGGKALHGRNVHQVLGEDPDNPVPSTFVVCWTPRGQGGGGTGQALRVAHTYKIPIVDLAKKGWHPPWEVQERHGR